MAIAEYGNPAISRTDDAVLISGEEPPSGLYFRRNDLAPSKTYHLEISGEFLYGAPTVRIQRDDREFEYRAAPDGKLELDIVGWRVAKYGTPTVASTEKDITISGNGSPSGIYFRRNDLDKRNSYKLALSGK